MNFEGSIIGPRTDFFFLHIFMEQLISLAPDLCRFRYTVVVISVCAMSSLVTILVPHVLDQESKLVGRYYLRITTENFLSNTEGQQFLLLAKHLSNNCYFLLST